MRTHNYISTFAAAIFFALMLCPTTSMAQKPVIGFIYPAGGSQNSVVDIEIGGMNTKEATSVIVSGEGITTEIIPIPPPEPTFITLPNGRKKKVVKKKNMGLNDQSAPQLASRLGVRVHIAADAEIGLRDLRVQTASGVSNQLNFEVSSYPNFVESQTLDAGEINDVESLPATLCGYVKPGEVDRFRFSARAGELLVAEVKGRTLVPYIADAVPGWFQPVIRLVDSKGRQVAFADDFHTSPDPVMMVKIPHDGKYTLSINDAIFRGRQDFNYRIQLGEIPFIHGIYPLVTSVGEKSDIKVSGVNIPTDEISVKPTEEGVHYLRVEGKDGKPSNLVSYYAVDKGVKIIDTPTPETKLILSTVIYDHISTPYEQRKYTLPITEGVSVVVDALARRIDSRADLRITLLSPSGKVVKESDDIEDTTQGLMTHHADPVIEYKAQETGNYTLLVEDIQGRAGMDHSFVLRRMKPSAPIEAFVTPANITLSQGGTTSFTINFHFKGDKRYSGVSHIELDGLPKGYKVSQLTPGRNPKTWDVSVTAPMGAEVGTFPIKVYVHTLATQRTNSMAVEAKATVNMTQAFYYIHRIPAAAFTAEVVPAIPYSVHFEEAIEKDLDKPVIINKQDTCVALKVIVDRRNGFDKELELALTKKSKAITLSPVTIAGDESEKIIYLKVDRTVIDKYKYFRFATAITATVNGDIRKMGQRTYVNALYKDMTPIIILMKEGTVVNKNTGQKQNSKKPQSSAQKAANKQKSSAAATRVTSPRNNQTTRTTGVPQSTSRVGATSSIKAGSDVPEVKINTLKDL